MEGILSIFVLIVFTIVLTEIINEKFFKISSSIALLLVSFCISVLLVILSKFNIITDEFFIIQQLQRLHLDKLLLEGTLCFMIFAGASKMQFPKFINNFKTISAMSIIATVLNAIIYSALFYFASIILNLGIDPTTCVLLGCIISPTDPISATTILNKLGLPKGISSVIEGESLFNDGIGVALFVFIENIITKGKSPNFAWIVGKNIFGAVLVGLISSYILFRLIKYTKNPNMHILISLLNVSFCYLVCEDFGFSGVISAVVSGIYFSYQNKKCERWKKVVDPSNLYTDFWNIIDELLNKSLFVLIGLSAFLIPISPKIIWIIPIAIIVNFISRYLSVKVTGTIIGKSDIPNNYTIKSFTKLMTICAMRGGISLAMAFTTINLIGENDYTTVLNVTIITILFTTIINGLLIPVIYKQIQEDAKKKSLIIKNNF